MGKNLFINHTNHPSHLWCKEQREAACAYGEILDVPFPEVDPHAGTEDVRALAEKNMQQILALSPAAVLCQGEYTYVYFMVTMLKSRSIPVLASSSERVSSEIRKEDGSHQKTSVFRFVKFREY